MLPLFFLQIASLRAPLECGGLLSWLPVFKQRPHLWRLPLQGGPQESGSRHAHLPSLHPPPQGRTGQVGPRGLTASPTVPACGCLGGLSEALQTESTRQMFVTIPDQDSEDGKGAGICEASVLDVFPRPVGSASSCAWTTLDRRPSRGHKDQGLNVGCYSPRPVPRLEDEKTQTSRTLRSTRPSPPPRENEHSGKSLLLREFGGALKGYSSSGRGQSPTHPRKA